MAVYAIGDLQGCYRALQKLLKKLNFNPAEDQIWFCGDLINRGPESLQCLRAVRDLCTQGSAVTVLGNHDLHLLAVAHGLRNSGRRDTLGDILVAPDRDALLDWLRQQPLIHSDEKLGYTMLHAGLPPQWTVADAETNARLVEEQLRGNNYLWLLQNMYGNEPSKWSDDLAENNNLSRWRFTINALTRLRYCTPKGRMDLSEKGAPETEPANSKMKPWFTHKKAAWAGSKLVVGHWSTAGARRENNKDGSVTMLDSGCVWGACLSAVQLDAEHSTEPVFIQISC